MEYRSNRSNIEIEDNDEDDEDSENQLIKFKKNFNWRNFFNKKKLLENDQEETELIDQDLSDFFEINQDNENQLLENDQEETELIDQDNLEFSLSENSNIEKLNDDQFKIIISKIAQYNLEQMDENDYRDFPHSVQFLEDLSNNGELITVFENIVNQLQISQPNDLENSSKSIMLDQPNDLQQSFINNKSINYTFLQDQKQSFIEDLSKQIYQVKPKIENKNNNEIMINNIVILEQVVNEKTEIIKKLEKPLLTKTDQFEKTTQKFDLKKEINPTKQNFELKTEPIKSVEHSKVHLNDREYLNLASNIKIEGANLKTIYLNREISLNGLKRVVDEYLRTGTIEEYLKYELLEHQKDFERDPLLKDVRDKIHQIDQSNSKQFTQLIEETVLIKNKNISEQLSPKLKENNDQQKVSFKSLTSLDISLIVIIAILISLILILLIFNI